MVKTPGLFIVLGLEVHHEHWDAIITYFMTETARTLSLKQQQRPRSRALSPFQILFRVGFNESLQGKVSQLFCNLGDKICWETGFEI